MRVLGVKPWLNSLHPQPLPARLAAFGVGGGCASGFKRRFVTHPPLMERIAELRGEGT